MMKALTVVAILATYAYIGWLFHVFYHGFAASWTEAVYTALVG